MSKKNHDHYGAGECVCGHDRSSHYKETTMIETDEGIRSMTQYRNCLGMFCDCRGFLKRRDT
jgi:hypothetical protein